jgi:antitoxin (DNA-binding transcriptional repressor) of toxin-antitoxin stability system
MIVSLEDAKADLADLIDRAARGEDIVIRLDEMRSARLVTDRPGAKQPRPGAWEGNAWIADDFDDALPPEILKGFYDSK